MNERYLQFLKTEIFKTEEYHQFNLLFDAALEFLSNTSGQVAILERSYIYGGRSLFAQLVSPASRAIVIDYRPLSAETRANFQGSWLDESEFSFQRAANSITDLGSDYHFSFERLDAQALIIPNVLHHCRDFPSMMKSLESLIPSLRHIFIYDSYLREGHQTPDDYCRYTPSALKCVMRELGFEESNLTETGNIFDGILYLLSQAEWQLETYKELSDLRSSLNSIVPRLRGIRSDPKYRFLGRPYAYLSTAYAMSFTR